MRKRKDAQQWPLPQIEHAAWLGDACLLLVTASTPEGDARPRVALFERGADRLLEARSMSLLRADEELLDLLVVGGAPSTLRSGYAEVLNAGAGQPELRFNSPEFDAASLSANELVRSVLAPLDAGSRSDVTAFLASALDLVPAEDRNALSEQVYEIRQALRERLPKITAAPNAPLGAHVDRLLAVDERAFFVEGWINSREAQVARLTAISPEGGRTEILEHLCRSIRPDVVDFFAAHGSTSADHHGMLCFFELDAPSVRGAGWVFEIEDRLGHAYEIEAPEVLDDPLAVRSAVLAAPALDQPLDQELMASHIYPAISRIQRRIGTEPVINTVTELGESPRAPEISIVVPIYKRIDHLEAQLAEFADDPDILASDLIYVLDSPEQGDELQMYAADLYPIYRVPVRIAVLEKNVGFAGACNAGGELARGRLLLLLNSDVLPDRPGWLGTMRDFYDATPGIGALGPKLLYEDDSIQHAGMYYDRLPGTSFWVDGHSFKGMHRSLSAANVARSVPLVSGACTMIDLALYRRLGGLPREYVQGDYEDSDLCLKLLGEGLENWYLPETELYHLEGQSYPPGARRSANRFNMWLHNRLHRGMIESIASAKPIRSDDSNGTT
jgi:GT2 family glycosyltransferase